ncbi:MAPEG family protein [Mesorhizobium sp. M0159]|uniref:MAPEG family protein n=1 Tax=unclassified Mesorhizobium TaxID=325217 RepID=UPI00333E09A1
MRLAYSEAIIGRPVLATRKPLRSRGSQDASKSLRNFLETFPVFVAGVFLVHALARESGLSQWGAGLYFSARLVYLPPYAAGVPLVRSLAWNVAFVGIVLLLLAALWPEL